MLARIKNAIKSNEGTTGTFITSFRKRTQKTVNFNLLTAIFQGKIFHFVNISKRESATKYEYSSLEPLLRLGPNFAWALISLGP